MTSEERFLLRSSSARVRVRQRLVVLDVGQLRHMGCAKSALSQSLPGSQENDTVRSDHSRSCNPYVFMGVRKRL